MIPIVNQPNRSNNSLDRCYVLVTTQLIPMGPIECNRRDSHVGAILSGGLDILLNLLTIEYISNIVIWSRKIYSKPLIKKNLTGFIIYLVLATQTYVGPNNCRLLGFTHFESCLIILIAHIGHTNLYALVYFPAIDLPYSHYSHWIKVCVEYAWLRTMMCLLNRVNRAAHAHMKQIPWR